ncbi:predicted protein [Arabidopsis lyrata subsp. lyrata]|uniref:Predicted protein n=2 Tax=Arabidopsis TaxID=3701 RepID=D7MKD9_ARALL|nr:predicted protein [Arabidopsis lyrata subsp. lyrata]
MAPKGKASRGRGGGRSGVRVFNGRNPKVAVGTSSNASNPSSSTATVPSQTASMSQTSRPTVPSQYPASSQPPPPARLPSPQVSQQ